MTAVQFDLQSKNAFNIVMTFKGKGESLSPLPEMIFLGISHSSQGHTIPSFLNSLDQRERYQVIFELRDDKEVVCKRLPFVESIPIDMVKKGWDDPKHVKRMKEFKTLLSHVCVINHYPNYNYTPEQFQCANERLRPLYDEYVRNNQRSFILCKTKIFPKFPDRETQEISDFVESVEFLRKITTQKMDAVSEADYYHRQERLCQKIKMESSPSIWVGGSAHFSEHRGSSKSESRALKLFIDTVRKTGRSAIVVISPV